MTDDHDPSRSANPQDVLLLGQLDAANAAVQRVVSGIRSDQWSWPTPCEEWTVRRVLAHLVGMDRVFTALLTASPLPSRDEAPPVDEELPRALAESYAALRAAFARPGAPAHEFNSPMGSATGAERLQIRLYDLLAQGWDLARATGQRIEVPEDVADASLVFAEAQLSDSSRPGRFAPAEEPAEGAPALDRLAAFLGRRTRR